LEAAVVQVLDHKQLHLAVLVVEVTTVVVPALVRLAHQVKVTLVVVQRVLVAVVIMQTPEAVVLVQLVEIILEQQQVMVVLVQCHQYLDLL